MEKVKSSEEIAQSVKDYFKVRGLSLQDVADNLGRTQQAVSHQLNGRPMGSNVARKYADIFGFNIEYLMTGRGSLTNTEPETPETPAQDAHNGVYIPRETLDMYNNMSASILQLTELVTRLTAQERPTAGRQSAPLYHSPYTK